MDKNYEWITIGKMAKQFNDETGEIELNELIIMNFPLLIIMLLYKEKWEKWWMSADDC